MLRVGEMREMVPARAIEGKPWARTTVKVVSAKPKGFLELVIRCEDPAAANMDFDRIDNDFVWGDDCVTLAFEGLGKMKVFKDGSQKGDFTTQSSVTHDRTGWTVTAKVQLPVSSGDFIRGNICRWRVGDVRQVKSSRVPGSRYEHSRLRTVFTAVDEDPAAFIAFALTR